MTSQKLSADDLKSILEFTTSLARKAGTLILEGSESIQAAGAEGESNVGEKKNSVDLVTEYDVRVEQLVQSELRSKYPTFKL
jgi:myo-inositol-1(or 4)-monophosphatase